MQSLAREKGCSPGQLVLAWLLHRGGDVVPIPGAQRRGHLEDNVGAVSVRLMADDLARIEEAMPPDSAAGDRYADMTTVGG